MLEVDLGTSKVHCNVIFDHSGKLIEKESYSHQGKICSHLVLKFHEHLTKIDYLCNYSKSLVYGSLGLLGVKFAIKLNVYFFFFVVAMVHNLGVYFGETKSWNFRE